MHLADVGLLKSEEIRLLADGLQPVFALELTPVAETLIQRELLQAFPAICQHGKLACFVLTTTNKGAAYVAAGIEDPSYPGKLQPSATSEQPKREKMSVRPVWAGALVLAFALLVLNGCGYYPAPRVIEADGSSYLACSGIVHVSSEGGLFGGETTYSVSFTNDDNMDTVVKGVHNVRITRIPATIKSGLQSYLRNSKTGTDDNGTPFVEGSTFLSGPGDKMVTFRNGVWVRDTDTPCYGPK